MQKKILYIDMDGVIADFDKGIKMLCPELETGDGFPDYESRAKRVNELCEANPEIFHDLEPIDGAIQAVNALFEYYEVYFLSTPMWNVPMSFTGKRIWLEKHFGERAAKRLILTHRKDLAIGHFLVDDRTRNGAGEFTGELILFGSPVWPDWLDVCEYLCERA